MVDYMEFVCTLNSTLIQTLITFNTKWVKLFESELRLKIKTLWGKRLRFYYICNNISKRFWKEVLLDWFKTVKSYSQHNIKVLNGLIWFNPNIKNNNT